MFYTLVFVKIANLCCYSQMTLNEDKMAFCVEIKNSIQKSKQGVLGLKKIWWFWTCDQSQTYS